MRQESFVSSVFSGTPNSGYDIILHVFLFQTSKTTSTSSSVSFSGDSVVIFIKCESSPSKREFRRCDLTSYILEMLLKTEDVETGIVRQIKGTVCKLGNIVTSISLGLSFKLQCNAVSRFVC